MYKFRDALSLRYGWKPNNMPQMCNCSAKFTVDHAMISRPTIHHNEIRDITATLPMEVCSNVSTEPTLQPLSGERMSNLTSKTGDGARVHICARGSWNASQDAFFDVRVFYPNASSNHSSDPPAAYRKHEQAK